MIEQEVKFGPKTGLEAVQNGEHAVVEVASYDDLKQSPLVRVTFSSSFIVYMYLIHINDILTFLLMFTAPIENCVSFIYFCFSLYF